MNNLDYSKVFEVLVKETANYVKVNNLKAMVLGVSGGIDSTVVAAICHEVSKQTGIPLIGRSLPIKNKSNEFDVSKLVGEAFCDDPKDSNRQNVTMRFMAVVDESHIGISTNAIKGQLGGEENEVKAIMWVKMSDLDNYQWAFNHKHLIEGIFHTYVDYEEIEDLDNLFAE